LLENFVKKIWTETDVG